MSDKKNEEKEVSGLTEDELKLLRAKFRKRQDKFIEVRGSREIHIPTPIHLQNTAGSKEKDEDAFTFERVNVSMNPATAYKPKNTFKRQEIAKPLSSNSSESIRQNQSKRKRVLKGSKRHTVTELKHSVKLSKDDNVYDKLDEKIVLDTNAMQSIATDLVKGSKDVNVNVIGDDIANKLADIERKESKEVIDDSALIKKQDKPEAIPVVAKRVVDALTTTQVLGKVLTPEESLILQRYFNRQVTLSEEVLASLDTALDKILTRAHDFYSNKEELDEFLKDRPKAKSQLLDALIAKKSSFLADLMNDANMYAEMISKGLIDAYLLAAKGILVLRDNIEQLQAAAELSYKYSKAMAAKGMKISKDAAKHGKELAEKGATAATAITKDVATKSIRVSKEIAGTSKAVVQDVAKTGKMIACDAAEKGVTVAKQSLKRSEEMARLSCDKTRKVGKELAKNIADQGEVIADVGSDLIESGIEAATESVGQAAYSASEAYESAMKSAKDIQSKIKSDLSPLALELDKAAGWLKTWVTERSSSPLTLSDHIELSTKTDVDDDDEESDSIDEDSVDDDLDVELDHNHK